MSKHYLFSGGGTLGPVTPLLAVAEKIRQAQQGAKFTWVGTDAGPERAIVEAAGFDFFAVSSGKLRRYLSWQNLADVFRIAAGFFEALWLLHRLKPDVVASAGGFVAVPVVWAAWLLGIPTHVHQQDVRPGLANKLSAPFAASMSIAFEASLADFPRNRPVHTGNPVRELVISGSREDAARLWGLEAGVPTVLVLGGGTGAASLNAVVAASLGALCTEAQVIHLVGKGKAMAIPDAPQRYHQLEFLAEDIRHAYAAADVVVTRAGTGVLSELAALGKPAIIVPLPGTQQEDNAKYFVERGAAVLKSEDTLRREGLADAALHLLRDRDAAAAMADAARQMAAPGAAQRLADMLMGLSERSVN